MRFNLFGKTGIFVCELCVATAGALPREYPALMVERQNSQKRGVRAK